ncbi:FGGY family carbohydrate kinase [Salinicoccus siamensis]|uniref:FGGY family carbohydrate kinase n=1 Tax=Salinicoccus siamensis TaxID=381830 RepID=UPI00362368E5
MKSCSTRKPDCCSTPTSSGTKIKWILYNVDGAHEKLKWRSALWHDRYMAHLAFYRRRDACKLIIQTRAVHCSTTYMSSNGDKELLDILEVPESMLPEVKSSSEVYGKTSKNHFFGQNVPIAGVAGDRAALQPCSGQTCFNKGDAKNTYGTGCFLLMKHRY